MAEFTTSNIRNIALMGHGSEGKTTLMESMLFAAGITVRRVMHRFDGGGITLGTVREAGYRTVADFFADERNRRKLPDAILFDDDYLAASGIGRFLKPAFAYRRT